MKSQKGQVLLIIVMLLATVVTIVMAVMFRSTSNTQLTKLEEESNKALVAAEAGLEKAMKKNAATYTLSALGLSDYPGIDLTNSNVYITSEEDTTFVSSSIQKDGQYTFYMVDYDTENRTFGTSYYTDNITIYFASESGDCSARSLPALEVALVDKDNKLVKKLLEPCSGSGNYITGSDMITVSSSSKSIEGVTFSYEAILGPVSDTKLMIVRSLFAGTKIGLEGSGNLKPQGRLLSAHVKAYSGVEKKVQLFQSYPQILADFFVTSF